MSSHLFSPISFRDLTLDNRIAVSAMCQYASEDGSANDWHLMHYGNLVMGAGGLLITEATHVSAEGRISPKCLGLYSDENEATIKRFVDFCKEYGAARARPIRQAKAASPLRSGSLARRDSQVRRDGLAISLTVNPAVAIAAIEADDRFVTTKKLSCSTGDTALAILLWACNS